MERNLTQFWELTGELTIRVSPCRPPIGFRPLLQWYMRGSEIVMGQRPDCSRRFVPGSSPHRDKCPGCGTFIPMEPPQGAAKRSVRVFYHLCDVPLALLPVPFFFLESELHPFYLCSSCFVVL